MKVLIAGDTHGNIAHCHYLASAAVRQNCQIILQLGDFGYWESQHWGVVFIRELEDILADSNVTLQWIDGNHENHQMLRAEYGPRDDGLWEIRPHILYIPRGHRWEWDGVTCLGLGGAFSVDKADRIEGESWWPEETITESDVYHSVEGGHADVMFTHDCPIGVDPFGPGLNQYKDAFHESYANRQRLTAVVDEVKPLVLFHGHYHHRHDLLLEGSDYATLIHGLNRDGMLQDSWYVLDMATLLEKS